MPTQLTNLERARRRRAEAEKERHIVEGGPDAVDSELASVLAQTRGSSERPHGEEANPATLERTRHASAARDEAISTVRRAVFNQTPHPKVLACGPRIGSELDGTADDLSTYLMACCSSLEPPCR